MLLSIVMKQDLQAFRHVIAKRDTNQKLMAGSRATKQADWMLK